ncbi:MAG TPA: HigA family addiction module antitoxin [Anaerolineaceae bacterium]|nr:HigA family addiction module antitoxin [Anaerolineaceae bacterium]
MTTVPFIPIHPGEILLEEFLNPLGISQNLLAKNMRVAPGRINEIVNGKRGITAETALRLACALGTTPEFWLNLQMKYDLHLAEQLNSDICKEVIPFELA